METEIRRYRDAYGSQATAIRDAYGPGWKVTLVRGKSSKSRWCSSLAMVKRVLAAWGYSWTEVDRWVGRTIPTA